MRHFIRLAFDVKVSGIVLAAATLLSLVAILNVTNSSGQQTPEGDDYEGKRARQAAPTTDPSKALFKDPATAPTPLPNRSAFITEEGFLRLPQFDDRHISEEEKAQNPWRDSAWAPFIRCMQEDGFGTYIVDPDVTTQADINQLVYEVNQYGPFYRQTTRGFEYQPTPASDAFLRCETIFYAYPRPILTGTPLPMPTPTP